jgi:hypothetical protein
MVVGKQEVGPVERTFGGRSRKDRSGASGVRTSLATPLQFGFDARESSANGLHPEALKGTNYIGSMVRSRGLEPSTPLRVHAPQASASANSATTANRTRSN